MAAAGGCIGADGRLMGAGIAAPSVALHQHRRLPVLLVALGYGRRGNGAGGGGNGFGFG
jgi:hypothetical protein